MDAPTQTRKFTGKNKPIEDIILGLINLASPSWFNHTHLEVLKLSNRDAEIYQMDYGKKLLLKVHKTRGWHKFVVEQYDTLPSGVNIAAFDGKGYDSGLILKMYDIAKTLSEGREVSLEGYRRDR